MRAGIIAQQDRRTEAQQRVLALIDEISGHASKRPEVAEFLPDDPQVAAWRKEHERLVRLRDAASANIPPEPNKVKALQLAHDIQVLEFSERNLLESLRDTLGKFDSGGLDGVHPYKS